MNFQAVKIILECLNLFRVAIMLPPMKFAPRQCLSCPIFLFLCLAILPQLHAQTFSLIKNFSSNDGITPVGGLILSSNTLYGTTTDGGGFLSGTLFKINTDGSNYTVLKNFSQADGYNARPTLTLSGNTLYGTTYYGGSSNYGTVFKVNTDGSNYTVLMHFTNSDSGQYPEAGVTLSGDTLYGATLHGGNSDRGLLFKLNTNGTGFTVIKQFASGESANPKATLTLSGNTLYGISLYGGISNIGTVFKINTDGSAYAILKSFTGTNNGDSPCGSLVLSGSTLYGTTFYGGSSDNGTVFSLNTNGTGFTVLKSFAGSDGALPFAGLTLSGSTLYGTTSEGGNANVGTVFKLKTDGSAFTVLKSLTPSDGQYLYAGATLGESTLYGAIYAGGTGGNLFSLLLSPQLTVTRSETNVTILWPSPSFGFSLEKNTSLNSAGWTTFSGTQNDDGTNKSVTVSSSTTNNLFFRLKLIP